MHFALMFLLLMTCVHGILQMKDVVEVMPENVEGGCSREQIARLTAMWTQMQEVTWILYALMKDHTGKKEPQELEDALWAFMATRNHMRERDSGKFDAHPLVKTGKSKVVSLIILFQHLFDGLTSPDIYGIKAKKRQLYCNGSPLEYYGPDATITRRVGTRGPRADKGPLKSQSWYNPKLYYWYLPTLRGGGGIVGEPGRSEDKKPEPFCDRPSSISWAIAGREIHRTRNIEAPTANDVIILCPNFFNQGRRDTNDPSKIHPYPDTLDVKPGNENLFPSLSYLDDAQPKWLSLYHELAWLHMGNLLGIGKLRTVQIVKKPDAPPYYPIPAKIYWEDGKDQIRTVEQCNNVAKYDLAAKLSTKGESQAIKSPRNVCWLALAVYLWFESGGQQGWASGRARLLSAGMEPPSIAKMPDRLPEHLRPKSTGRNPGAGKVPRRKKNQKPSRGENSSGDRSSEGSNLPIRKRPKQNPPSEEGSHGDGSSAGSDIPVRQRPNTPPFHDPGEGPSSRLRTRPNPEPYSDSGDEGGDGSGNGPGHSPRYDPNDSSGGDPDDHPGQDRPKGKGKAPVHRPHRRRSDVEAMRAWSDGSILNVTYTLARP